MSRDEDMIVEDKEGLSIGGEFEIRQRLPWSDLISLNSDIRDSYEIEELLDADDTSCLIEEEDCERSLLFPFIPKDEDLLDSMMTKVLKAGIFKDQMDLGAFTNNAAASKKADVFIHKVRKASWTECRYQNLPSWLQDNDCLLAGHRPPLASYYACFMSIFQIHTETGNIWSHLLGCLAFIGIAIFFLNQPPIDLQLEEKLVFAVFFAGVIVCLGMSFISHTFYCHSKCVGILITKLDYCGIAMLIMSSFVPWLYYGFYCDYHLKLIYLSVIIIMSITSIAVSLWERFSEPIYRPLRVAVFVGFAFCGVIIPSVHHIISNGWSKTMTQASLGWIFLMGCIDIFGAMFYVLRIPERYFPGKFDIWFQSHQIFHVSIIAGSLAHFHGLTKMAMYRNMIGECSVPSQ